MQQKAHWHLLTGAHVYEYELARATFTSLRQNCLPSLASCSILLGWPQFFWHPGCALECHSLPYKIKARANVRRLAITRRELSLLGSSATLTSVGTRSIHAEVCMHSDRTTWR